MKRVLITGVAGFLGSHLAERFLQEGWEVYGADNFLTGQRENVELLSRSPHFHFEEKDVRFGVPFSETPVDLILHFASPASVPDYLAYPIETLEVNGRGTHLLMEHARQRGSRFLYASTSEVYGDPEVHPQPETYVGHVDPTSPRGVYDEAKRYGEALVLTYFRKYHLDVRITRIFNTYGPRMRLDDGRVVSNLLVQALQRQPLTVYGDGTQTRSFCYVDDLVEGIYRLATYDDLSGQVVNLGNEEEIPILELAQTIQTLVGEPLSIEHRPLPPRDPKRRRPDLTRARTLLHWEPRVSLREGLTRTLKFFQAKLGVPS